MIWCQLRCNAPIGHIVLVALATICLRLPPVFAATPGLPFTEDFSATNLRDASRTNANWSTDDELLSLGYAKKLYGALVSSTTTGVDIHTDADNSSSVAAGDFNGDGNLDAVVGNTGNPNRAYFGDGDAAPFSATTRVNLVAQSYDTASVATGDIDRDGDLDVVTGNTNNQINYAYLNDGTGLNWTEVPITADTYKTEGVALVDVNADGKLDLVAANFEQRSRVYINDGSGDPWDTVTSISITTDQFKATSVAAADFDNDGDVDLAIGNKNQINRVYLNSGDGTTWTGFDVGTNTDDTSSLSVADMDADGDVDIVAGNRNQLNRVYLNNGTGTSWTPVNVTADTYDTKDIAAADVDSDGDFDVVAGSDGVNHVYFSDGDSNPFNTLSTGAEITSDSNDTRSIALADFDRDGDPDLVCANAAGGAGEITRYYANNADGNPWAAESGTDLGSNALDSWSAVLADMDRDGDLDAVIAAQGDPNELYMNTGLAAPWTGVIPQNITSDSDRTVAVAVGDINRDGLLDVLTANYGDGPGQVNKLYLNDGTSTPFATSTGLDITTDAHGSYDIEIGDVDRDGDLDVVVANFLAGEPERLYLNDGGSPWTGSWTASDIANLAGNTTDIALADLNNDGLLDVVTSHVGGVYLNAGSGSPWTPSWVTASAPAGGRKVVLGDVDQDGDIDAVYCTSPVDGPIQLVLNNGSADPFFNVTPQSITSTGLILDIELVDVDADSDLDLLTGRASLTNRVYLNNGTSTPYSAASAYDVSPDEDETYGLCAGDADSDGDVDLIALQRDETKRYYANPGAPFYPWSNAKIDELTNISAASVAIGLADLDSDGDLDMVVGDRGNGPPIMVPNNGTSKPWSGATPVPIGSQTYHTSGIATGDVNNDGHLDVIATNGDGYSAGFIGTEPNLLYVNNGTTTPWFGVSGIQIGTQVGQSSDPVLGDVDNDGNLDLFIAHKDTVSQLYLNDGDSNPFDSIAPFDFDRFGTVTLADLNRDGWLDVVMGREAQGPPVIFFNNKTSAPFSGVSATILDAASINAGPMAAGDVDGDGDLDLVATQWNNPTYVYFNTNGIGTTWLRQTVPSTAGLNDGGSSRPILRDFDLDGDLDLLMIDSDRSPALLRLYLNNGTNDPWNGVTFLGFGPGSHPIDVGFQTQAWPRGMAVDDVDRDGTLDAVVGWFINGGGAWDASDTVQLYRRVGANNKSHNLATSLQVDDTIDPIAVTRMTATATLPPNTSVRYWLSNNGGVNWYELLSGGTFIFPTSGADLRWRAELSSLLPLTSPSVDTIEILGGIPFIDPPVPNFMVNEGEQLVYDLTQHENDTDSSGTDLDWTLNPPNTASYSSTIDDEDVLTIDAANVATTTVTNATLTLTDPTAFTTQQNVTITVKYNPPTAPTPFVLPSSPYTTDNLICLIVPGFIGTGRTAQYTYTWTSGPKLVVHGPTTETEDILESSNTAGGEIWTCTVVANDGVTNSPAAFDSTNNPVQDLIVSTLTLNVLPSTVTLGQFVTVSGSISPSAPGVSVFFDDSVAPPGGTTALLSTQLTNTSSQFSFIFPPDAAGAWSIVGEWLGNITTYGDFASAPISVLKATPSVALSLNASSVPIGYDELEATVHVTAPIPASLNGLLAGLPVKLFARLPDGSSLWSPAVAPVKTTDANGIATFTAADLATAGLDLSSPGTWQWRADFAGNSNFNPAVSPAYDQPDSVRLTVRDEAGYAVLVVGRLNQAGEGVPEHNKTGDFVYRSLRDRGLPEEDIYYLRQGDVPATPQYQDITVDDTTPTQADVQYAITVWAAARMQVSPAPFYLIFVDHGSPEEFYVFANVFDETMVITPTELDGYLDALESFLGAKADEPDTDRIFIYGACRSGSFIPGVSATGRTVITSSSASEVSHRGVVDPADGVRDGEMFVTELFRNLRQGKNFKESFELATDQVQQYAQGPANGSSEPPQTPLLDDNGDSVGSSGELSFAQGEDGGRAYELALGYGVNSGGAYATWLAASSTITLGPTDPMPPIEALTDKRPATNVDAWIEVKGPGYAGDDQADPAFEDSQEVLNLDVVLADAGAKSSDIDNGLFRWSFATPQEQAIFDDYGTYAIYYYIRDYGDGDDPGEVSAYLLTTVYREQPGNQPPLPVSLVFPGDGDQVQTTTFLAWDETTDPESDPLTYRLEVAEDNGFTTGLIVREGLTDTLILLSEADGLQDLTTYYWRVIPVDAYGATPATNEVRTFNTNNGNPTLPGSIGGRVKSTLTGLPISGATLTLTPGFAFTSSNFTGQYSYLNLAVGTYTVQVSANGFQSDSQLVTVFAGQQRTADFTLNPQTGSLQVTITPQGARDDGAQWRVDGGIWRNSGFIVAGLPAGLHTVNYKSLQDWTKPTNEQVTIQANQTKITSGAYSGAIGSLQVTLAPQDAIDEGAQWRVDGGAWQNSGATVAGLSVGTHTLEYKTIPGWVTPATTQPSITADTTTPANATYAVQPPLPLRWRPIAVILLLMTCTLLIHTQRHWTPNTKAK